MSNTFTTKDIKEDCVGLDVRFYYNGKDREGRIVEVKGHLMTVDLTLDGDTVTFIDHNYKSFLFSGITGLEVMTPNGVEDIMANRQG